MNKIFSIIVTYNGMRNNWIQKCLDSLMFSSLKTEIIVIDNNSADETVGFIKENYPSVELVTSNENLGFAKANNIGIKKAYEKVADFIFLLNQDAWIEIDTIEKLVEIFKNIPNTGIVSPVHLNGTKKLLDGGFVNYLLNRNTPNFISDLYFNRLQPIYETNYVNAAAWLISRACVEKIGVFDTSVFYHYGEDDNYCHRALYHGFKIYICSSSTICHDREERQGIRPEEHENKRSKIALNVKLSNILKDDKEIYDVIYKLKKQIIKILIKKLIKLQFKKFFIQLKEAQNDFSLFMKIKESRKINKLGGLVWL